MTGQATTGPAGLMTRLPAVVFLGAFLLAASPVAAADGTAEGVLGLSFRGAQRAYRAGISPSPWILNDVVGRQEVVIYYDKERALARAWVRMVLGEPILFAERPMGTVGDDLTTMTRWDLATGEAVSGNLAGMQLVPLKLHETTLDEWQRRYPDSTLFPTDP
jgi:hypothetical protein